MCHLHIDIPKKSHIFILPPSTYLAALHQESSLLKYLTDSDIRMVWYLSKKR